MPVHPNSKRAFKNLLKLAHHLAEFVCPNCDKAFKESKVNLRGKYKPGACQAHKYLWTCPDCKATHTEGRERLIKP